MKLSQKLLAASAVILFVLGASTSANAVVTGDQGVPSSNTSFTWNFAGTSPAVTATFAGTPSANMKNKSNFSQWSLGNTTWSSLQLDANPYTPESVFGATNYGLGMGWDSTDSLCTSTLPANGSIVPGTIYNCAPQTVTLTFSNPVTDPVINVTNIAGGGTYATLWSTYQLREPGTIVLRSKMGNFAVSNDARGFGVINPPGTGFDASSAVRYQKFDVLPNTAKPTLYGAGYGAIQIIGTFTTLTFDVTLNYLNFTNSQLASPNVQTTNRSQVPEWVAFTPALGVAALASAPAAVESQTLANTGSTLNFVLFFISLGAFTLGSVALFVRSRVRRFRKNGTK